MDVFSSYAATAAAAMTRLLMTKNLREESFILTRAFRDFRLWSFDPSCLGIIFCQWEHIAEES